MADEQMVKVDLDNTVGHRLAGTRGPVTLYGPGKGIEVPVSLARALGITPAPVGTAAGATAAGGEGEKRVGGSGDGERAGTVGAPYPTIDDVANVEDFEGRLTSDGPGGDRNRQAQQAEENKKAQQGGGGDKPAGQAQKYSDWTVSDLKDEAEFRELAVARDDGADGAPRKQDYIRALEQDDGSKASGGQE